MTNDLHALFPLLRGIKLYISNDRTSYTYIIDVDDETDF